MAKKWDAQREQAAELELGGDIINLFQGYFEKQGLRDITPEVCTIMRTTLHGLLDTMPCPE